MNLADPAGRFVPVLDAAQSAAWDESSRNAGVPSRVLMESAGRGAARVIADEFQRRLGDGVIVTAGHGNNGGDGWVVARALHAAGIPVSVAEHDRERSSDCEANRSLALADGVSVVEGEWPRAGVIVDALLGTGASGPPRGPLGRLARRIVESGCPVAAIDGPTGLDLTSGQAHGPVHAHLTVTFGGIRRGHLLARNWCGAVVAIDIGFSAPDAQWPELITDSWSNGVLPRIESTMHKGNRGRVAVVGGEAGMAGAVHHAARAAFGVGAGLVRVAAAPASVSSLQASLPDATAVCTALGPEPEPGLLDLLSWADAVVLGPGLGRGDSRTAFVHAVLESSQVPVVVDADALHAGRTTLHAGSAPRVLTPHLGEFEALRGDAVTREGFDPFAAAAEEVEDAGLGSRYALLLKGVPTVVAVQGSRQHIVASGNPALATGGSGDLLAGFIGAFLARGLEPQVAAGLGAHILGRAAEAASERSGVRSTRPADVLAALPEALGRLSTPGPKPPVLIRLEPPATA